MGYTIPLVSIFGNMETALGVLISAIALIIAITIHEFSHAYVADKLGDPTARSQGRLSLNPLVHLDPIGTIMLIIARFGWGKPVPIDPYNFSNPRRDEIFVASAGVISNLLLALTISLLLPLTSNITILYSFLKIVVVYNVYLAVFNILPVPPLDGSKIFLNLLPVDTAIEWEKTFERYGLILLLALVFLPIGGSNIVSIITGPIINLILSVLL